MRVAPLLVLLAVVSGSTVACSDGRSEDAASAASAQTSDGGADASDAAVEDAADPWAGVRFTSPTPAGKARVRYRVGSGPVIEKATDTFLSALPAALNNGVPTFMFNAGTLPTAGLRVTMGSSQNTLPTVGTFACADAMPYVVAVQGTPTLTTRFKVDGGTTRSRSCTIKVDRVEFAAPLEQRPFDNTQVVHGTIEAEIGPLDAAGSAQRLVAEFDVLFLP